jgi:hypothetical protein
MVNEIDANRRKRNHLFEFSIIGTKQYIVLILWALVFAFGARIAAQDKPAKKDRSSETRKEVKEFVALISAAKYEDIYLKLHPHSWKRRAKEEWKTYFQKMSREFKKHNGVRDVSVELEKRQTYSDEFLFVKFRIDFQDGSFSRQRCMLYEIDNDWKFDW